MKLRDIIIGKEYAILNPANVGQRRKMKGQYSRCFATTGIIAKLLDGGNVETKDGRQVSASFVAELRN